MKQTDIIFIRVANNRAKLWHLTNAIQRHFMLHQRVLLAVADKSVADYVDDLLWRMPEESFMPHQISNNPCEDQIVITMTEDNVNRATVLFNLLTTPHKGYSQFEVVYELYDETDSTKEAISKKRLEAYPHSRFLPLEP